MFKIEENIQRSHLLLQTQIIHQQKIIVFQDDIPSFHKVEDVEKNIYFIATDGSQDKKVYKLIIMLKPTNILPIL